MALIDLVKEIRTQTPSLPTSASAAKALSTSSPAKKVNSGASNYHLDEPTERQLFEIVGEMVDDSNSEVKNKAVDA
jgi:hypothetical protein